MHLFCFCKVQGVVHILKLNAYLYTNTFVYCYSLSLWILSGFCNMLNAIEYNVLFLLCIVGQVFSWKCFNNSHFIPICFNVHIMIASLVWNVSPALHSNHHQLTRDSNQGRYYAALQQQLHNHHI